MSGFAISHAAKARGDFCEWRRIREEERKSESESKADRSREAASAALDCGAALFTATINSGTCKLSRNTDMRGQRRSSLQELSCKIYFSSTPTAAAQLAAFPSLSPRRLESVIEQTASADAYTPAIPLSERTRIAICITTLISVNSRYRERCFASFVTNYLIKHYLFRRKNIKRANRREFFIY